MYENEQELFSGAADKLMFGNLRKGTVRLVLTDQRVIVKNVFTASGYDYQNIVRIERFKAMFMNIGIRFCMQDGSKVELATRHIKRVTETLRSLGKEVIE